jgi:biopolymer transport protein ExbD
LIVFMVTAKIIVSQGMPMDLPKAASGEEVQNVFSVELTTDGKVRVDSTAVASDDAIADLAKQAKARNKDMRVVIRADKKVEHGRVIRVLDILKQAGLSKFAFGVAPVPRDDAAPAPAPPN